MTSIIILIQQRIFHFSGLKEVKLAGFKDLFEELKRFAEQFAIKDNVKDAEVEMAWSSFSKDEDDLIEVSEDEKTLRRFKKAEDFDELGALVEEGDDYWSTEYESDEEGAQDEGRGVENFIVLDD